MTNFLCGVAYKGTNYAGWQKQNNALGIQEVIEDAIFQALGQKAEIYASGRTDAGVHALCQCFSVKLKFGMAEKLVPAINSFLPNDIRLLWAKEVSDDFHARYSAHKKTYLYKLKVADIPSPFDFETTAYIDYKLNLKKMQYATKFLIGEHDFSAFCSANSSITDFVRTIYSFEIRQNENLFEFEVCGNGFLYNMVRILVGTLVDVGRGKINPEQIENILNSKDRQKAGKTMTPEGLFLKSVEY